MRKPIQYILRPYTTMKHCGKLIRNIDLSPCKNCVYYRPRIFVDDFTSPLNKCSNFGEKNIVTDEITLDYADVCRMDESKCGKSGKHFKQEPRMWLKLLKHQIFRPITLVVMLQTVILVFSVIR